jgi:hypothetical protein
LTLAPGPSDRRAAGLTLCWISTAKGYFFDDNAGSASVNSSGQGVASAPVPLYGAAMAHPRTTDSSVSPDGDLLIVESGAAATFDVFSVGTTDSRTALETLFNLPVAPEGIVTS